MREKVARYLPISEKWFRIFFICIFGIWMFLILGGALNDINLSPWGLTGGILKLVLVISLLFLMNTKLHFFAFFYRTKFVWIILLIIFAFIWQLNMVFSLSAPVGWDVGSVFYSLSDSNLATKYLSYNPNNGFLFFLQLAFLKVLRLSPTWITIDLINLGLFDLSLLLNVFTVRVCDKRGLYPILILQSVLMFFFVQIIMPYSDVMVLPFVSLLMLGISLVLKSEHTYVGSLLFAIGSLCAYLMKPSALIPALIFILFLLLRFMMLFVNKNISRRKLKAILVPLMLFSFIFVSGVNMFKKFEYSNNIVLIKKGEEEPVSHFIAIGITDKGMWNSEQNAATRSMHSKKERDDYSKKVIKKRLSQLHFFGFVQFLINKNYGNTSDGTFGWFRGDGPYISRPAINFWQKIYYDTGMYYHDYQFLYQTLWIFSILLLLFGISSVTDFTQLLRIAILGGLAFLLVFEGGRSRYLIQFLPLILILNALTFRSTIKIAKNSVNRLLSV